MVFTWPQNKESQKYKIEVNSVAQIETPRFGTLTYNEEDLLFFPRGIPGFYTLLYWMVAGDEENPRKVAPERG